MPAVPFLAPAGAATQLNETEFQLYLTPATPSMPADGNSYYVMIQLQDTKDEKPIVGPEDFVVTLISSDPSVVRLPEEKLTFGKGESILKATLVTTDNAGIATITALAEGAKSSETLITTYKMDSLEPTRLAIYAAPSSFIPDPQHVGLIYVQVLNSQNLPSVSKNDVAVDLSSSQPTVGKVPSYVVIPAGRSGVLVDFTPQKQTGKTTIKASAPGLAPGELTVTVDGPVGTKLVIDFAPDVIPAVSYHDAMMTVQLSDDAGKPVKSAKNLQIVIKSSDTSIVQVPQSIEIPAGSSYAMAYVQSKGKLGTATITATATGYETGFNDIEAVELSTATSSDPKVLQLYSVPSILPPDNSEHQSIVVAFLDGEGKPYRQTGWLYSRMVLSTSNTQIGEITSSTFTKKETYAFAKFKTEYAVGETTLTASLDGYAPTQMTLTVDGSGPAAVMLTQIPGIIEANNFGSKSLVINLADHNGHPVAAQEDTIVYISSADPEIAKVQASATIKAGESHTVTDVRASLKAGQTTMTGAADGLAAGSMDFRTVGFTGSVSEYHLGLFAIPKLPADGKEYQAVVVQLQDLSGLPVLAKSDIAITLSSSSGVAGSVQESVVIPAGSSFVSATFKTSFTKATDIKVTASSQGFASAEAEFETTVQPIVILKTAEFPSRADFGDEIRIGVDVYSGATPIKDAIVTIMDTNGGQTNSVTDENGHAEGIYKPTQPGTISMIVKVSKPGYEEKTLTSRITLLQTVTVTMSAETQGGNEITAQLKVQTPTGTKTQTTKPGSPVSYNDARWGEYEISAPEQITGTNAIYDFLGWSDGETDNPRAWNVIEDMQMKAVYKAKYLLQISDENDMARGTGYYDEGANAILAMPQTSIGGQLIDKNFAGWSGDIKSSSTTTNIVMDSPKIVKAEWADSYLKIALIGAAIAAGGFVYYWKIFKPKKRMEEKQRAPDLDWYKS